MRHFQFLRSVRCDVEGLTGQSRDRVDRWRRRHVVPLHPVMGRRSRPDPIRHAGNRLVLPIPM